VARQTGRLVTDLSQQASDTNVRSRGTLTVRRVGLWLAALFAPTTIVGYAIGVLAAEDGTAHAFDWSTAAIAATAVGTVLLAAFTGALAWTTSGDVTATWELADLTRREQAHREKPHLAVIDGPWYDKNGGVITVDVRNVGLGPALNLEFTPEGSDAYRFHDELQTHPAIAPGESWRFGVSVNLTAGPTTHEPTPIDFNVRVRYQDRAGRRFDVVAEGGPALTNIAAKLLEYNISGKLLE
jgi:hypothetical protein